MTTLSDGTAVTVLTGTQFGRTWLVRLAAVSSVALLAALGPKNSIPTLVLQLILAGAVLGGLALAGHAGSSPGANGDVHLAADIVHLIAVSIWLGGLLPYELYLRVLGKEHSLSSISAIQQATRRFSNIGMAAVLTIVATGLVNTYNLVGSVNLLTHTEYGRLLLAKLALVFAMVMLATFNRVFLTPALATASTVQSMRRNALIEVALGLMIIGMVAALGVIPPALLDHTGMQH